MSSTEQLNFTKGIYYIAVSSASGILEGRRLTDGHSYVTISPPDAVPDPRQKWLVTPVEGKKDFVIIERPPRVGPLVHNYLTYKGAPKPPQKGDQIVVETLHTNPFHEWHVDFRHFAFILRVDHSDLGITVGPNPLPDPTLVLDNKNELQWRFLPVGDDE